MDQSGARTALYDFGRDRYTAASLAVLGAPGDLRYGGGPDRTTPGDDQHWARVSAKVVSEYQETLRNGEVRRWVSTGLVFVQLFAPVIDRRAQPRLDQIAELVRSAFRLYQVADIEFTDSEINDGVNDEPNWLRANVSSTYTYRQFM